VFNINQLIVSSKISSPFSGTDVLDAVLQDLNESSKSLGRP